jgi:hypothetical protein
MADLRPFAPDPAGSPTTRAPRCLAPWAVSPVPASDSEMFERGSPELPPFELGNESLTIALTQTNSAFVSDCASQRVMISPISPMRSS